MDFLEEFVEEIYEDYVFDVTEEPPHHRDIIILGLRVWVGFGEMSFFLC